MSPNPNLNILRSLIQELRKSIPKQGNVKNLTQFEYIFAQFRRNAVTDLQYCRERDEMAYAAQTYSTYLKSQRHLKKLHEEYHGKGERTVDETAKMVGFKLPHDPK